MQAFDEKNEAFHGLPGCCRWVYNDIDATTLIREQKIWGEISEMNGNKVESEISRLKKSVQELQILNDIATAISSTMSTDSINQMILKKCIRHMNVEQGYITLFKMDEKKPGQARTFVRVADSSQAFVPIRLNNNLTGWMAKEKSSLMVNNAQDDRRFTQIEIQGSIIRSVLAVPLKVKNRMIGLLALFNKKTGEFTSDDNKILTIIGLQSAQVIESARLYEEEKKLISIQQELRAAQVIQSNLLPKNPPELTGFDIDGISIPAHVVGGDYYDYIKLPQNRIGIVLGDVSGKGLPAALLMSNLQATLVSQSMTPQSVESWISQTNQLLATRLESGKFVTLFLGVLDPEKRSFSFCNAGHNPPFFIRNNKEVIRLKTGGMVVGMFDNSAYESETITLNSGDVISIFSDGFTEAQNKEGNQFQEKGLLDHLDKSRGKTAREIISHLTRTVQSFQGDSLQNDDMTLVIIKCK